MTPRITPLTPADLECLAAFIERVPEGDRTFFREDLLAPGASARWEAPGGDERWIAVDGEDIVGFHGIVRETGWSSHVGDLRIVVDGTRRRSGIGRELALHSLLRSVELGLTKLVVNVAAEQDATLAMFAALGFQAEALLKDHVRDANGGLHDLIVMSHFVEEMWESLRATGLERAIGEA